MDLHGINGSEKVATQRRKILKYNWKSNIHNFLRNYCTGSIMLDPDHSSEKYYTFNGPPKLKL